MNRVVPLLLLVLTGCRRDEAVQAIIQLAPELKTSCVVLEVTDPSGQILDSKALPYAADHLELHVAVFRGRLPENVQLQARALWGSGCTEPLAYNGLSTPVPAHFVVGAQNVSLTLSPPGPDEDVDRDGFVSSAKGGPDCDDAQAERRPGRQEQCDASGDLNCDGLRGCDDATCANQTCSRVPASLNFTSAALTATAGQCALVTVERRDSTGALDTPGFATPLTLDNALPTSVAFYSDSSCSAAQAPPTEIRAAASSVTFYVRGTTVGDGSLGVSSPTLASASLSYSLRPAQVAKLAFTSPVPTSRAGDCYAVALESRDAFNNLSPTALAAVSISPAPTTPTQAAFYKDSGCTQPLDPATLPAATSQSFYFRATLATTFTLQGKSSGTNVLSSAQSWKISPRPASKISLTPETLPPLLAGQCSAPIHSRVLDEFGNLAPPGQIFTTTTTPPDAGYERFAGAGCVAGTNLPSTLDLRGCPDTQCSEGDVSFRAKTGGTLEIKTIATGFPDLKQTQVIIPTVRRGTCTMASTETAKSCNVNEAAYLNVPVDTTHAFVVFQATSDSGSPSAAFVRCALTPLTVDCKRAAAAATAITPAAVTIQWQVVEISHGLRVQHLNDVTCAASVAVTPALADITNTFVLFSSSQDGESVDQNDFTAVQLSSPTQLNTPMQVGCNTNEVFNFQLVQFTGSQVARGVTGAMNSESTAVSITGTPPDFTRTLLLSTWQVSTGGMADMNKRLIRGEIIPDASPQPQMRFNRGVDTTLSTNDIPQISWERITLPTGTLVQSMQVAVADLEPSKSVTLATPVDPTRTLVLTSSQAGGQGMGETSYATDDILGVAIGRLILTDSTHLSATRDSAHGKTNWTVHAIQFEP